MNYLEAKRRFNTFLDEKGHTHVGYPMLVGMYLIVGIVILMLAKS